MPGPIQQEGSHGPDYRRRRYAQIKPRCGCDQHTGVRLGSLSVPATSQGYRDLEQWAEDFGPVKAFGIEGTGSFGGGLSRSLLANGQTVIEVMRPNRQLRFLHGKSDNIDAEGAARSVLNGQATAIAKSQIGSAEMIRHLKIARDSAVKSRSQAAIILKTLIVNAPAELRDGLDKVKRKDRSGSLCRGIPTRGDERPPQPRLKRLCVPLQDVGCSCTKKLKDA